MAPPGKESSQRSMKRLFKNYIRGCKRKNIYWELTLEEFHKLTSSNCAYCEKPPAQRSRTYTYNGIDRMNNKRGYIRDNVVPACKECNFLKGDRLTFDEMKVVGEALKAFRQKK